MDMQNWFDRTQDVSGDLQVALEEMKAEGRSPTNPSDAEKYKAIKDMVDCVGYSLANNTEFSPDKKLKEWIEILEWAVKVLPEGYEKTREIFIDALANPRHEDYDSDELRTYQQNDASESQENIS